MTSLLKRLSRRSLTRDLILWLTLALSLVMVILGGAFYTFFTYRSGVDLEKRARLLSDEIAGILSRPAWDIDRDVARHITAAYLQNEIIAGIHLVFTPEIIVYDKPPAADEQYTFMETRTIFHDDDLQDRMLVGRVDIWFSRENIHALQMDLILMVSIMVLLSIIVVILVIRFLMSMQLRTPLNNLLQSVRSIAAGNYDSSIKPVPQEDVNAIIIEINRMAECIADHTSRLNAEILERKQVEKDLMERNLQMRNLSDNLPSGFVYQVIVGEDGKPPVFTYISAGVERLQGIPVQDALKDAMLLYDQFLPEDRQLILEQEALARKNMSLFQVEARYQPSEGRARWMSLTSAPRRTADGRLVWDGIAMDITERKALEGQLRHAQKMESMGILAGGVAHDFNNLLHVISGNIQVLLAGKQEDHPEAERLHTVARSVNRAAQLVRQLLLFSRKTDAALQDMDLNKEVEVAVGMLKRTIPRMISVEMRLSPEAWLVKADPVQVEQVLLNLASNAADAMPEGGRLLIETENKYLDSDFVDMHLDVSPGAYVLLSVTDTGSGIDRNTIERIFDPFFTTKEIGRGTGLGLATVYGVVKAHGGHIQCYSEQGQGTTFKIYWPAAQDQAVAQSHDQPGETDQVQGTETILVTDDDIDILVLTEEALQELGYSVIRASSGEEALEVHARFGENIDLVLLDLNMPGMGGLKCMEKLLERDPNARILIASGYTANGHNKSVFAKARGFIGKLYQLKDLAAKIRKILDE